MEDSRAWLLAICCTCCHSQPGLKRICSHFMHRSMTSLYLRDSMGEAPPSPLTSLSLSIGAPANSTSGGREVHVATAVGSPYTDASDSSFLDVQGILHMAFSDSIQMLVIPASWMCKAHTTHGFEWQHMGISSKAPIVSPSQTRPGTN